MRILIFFQLSIKYLLDLTYRTANIERVKFFSLCFLSTRLIKKTVMYGYLHANLLSFGTLIVNLV